MSENILFLTGRLAENGLHKVLAGMKPAFDYQVAQLGISVAALMTPEFIARRLPDARGADRILVPGLCKGDLSPLAKRYGIPVEHGPEDLKDIPRHFGQNSRPSDMKRVGTRIFAEIVEAPNLPPEVILARAEHFRLQGADVIDLGCLPNVPFPHLEESVRVLLGAGFQVSVDSVNSDELLRAGRAGADYLLSLTENSLWITDEVASTPVLIPARPGNLPSLYRAIEAMTKKDRAFLADPILDPIPFGFTESIKRYHALRKRYPDAEIMMGVGNLTELTDADTTGINAMLFGVVAELGIGAVLVTSVSPHARNAVREADAAWRLMLAAFQDRRLPRDYSDALLGLHDRRPFPYTPCEITELAAEIKDSNFRIMVSQQGVHIFNREGSQCDTDPFMLYPRLGVDDDASHAFYLGVELARAQIAWQLGKRYCQDEELLWGCNTPEADPRGRVAHRKAARDKKRDKPQ